MEEKLSGMQDKTECTIYDKMKEVLKRNEYVQILGIEILELEKGYCLGRMKKSRQILNPYETMHGGSLYSLADIVAGTAACTYGHYVTTVNGSMNFLLPAKDTEYIQCEAKAVRQGKHLAVYDVVLSDDAGKELENGSFTFFVTEQQVI